MDYFTLFNLAFSYSIDLTRLTRRYQELQRKYHPDRLANRSEIDKSCVLKQAGEINAAYQTLKHPLKRAEYMLTIYNNVDINHERHTMHDTSFLMEQLALREELDRIKNYRTAEDALTLFSSRLDKIIKRHLQEMEQQFHDEQLINAENTLRKLHFLDKLQQQVKQLEELLFSHF